MREEKGVYLAKLDGEKPIPVMLRMGDIRAGCKDWETFSSDAPFRVPIPSEEKMRSVRQLPIEVNPPEHSEYRAIVEPFFTQFKDEEHVARINELVASHLDSALARSEVEVVHEFALPLQSRSLALLMKVPLEEAEEWLSWGLHVFFPGSDGRHKGPELEKYIHRKLDEAMVSPGENMFSALAHGRFRGRPLTRDEMLGFANLAFAGGRDTMINSIAFVFAHLARDPEAIGWLRQDPKRVVLASEELFRALSPVSLLGRVCPAGTTVHGVDVGPDERVAFAWAAANFDETVFENPEEIRLDRKPNPHIAFGYGPHTCLGAPHARLVIRCLLRQIAERVGRIVIKEEEINYERRDEIERFAGYHLLRVSLNPHSSDSAIPLK